MIGTVGVSKKMLHYCKTCVEGHSTLEINIYLVAACLGCVVLIAKRARIIFSMQGIIMRVLDTAAMIKIIVMLVSLRKLV